jgi:hypothetical protein
MEEKDTLINLCDTCKKDVPICDGKDLEYGNGVGKDNIISCNSYERLGGDTVE